MTRRRWAAYCLLVLLGGGLVGLGRIDTGIAGVVLIAGVIQHLLDEARRVEEAADELADELAELFEQRLREQWGWPE